MHQEGRDGFAGAKPGALHETATALHHLSAVLGHELVHTLHSLRYVVDTLDGASPNAKTLDEVRGFAQSEIERIQQVITHLRRFRPQPPALAEMELLPMVERSIFELGSAVCVDIDVAPDLRVRTDARALHGALRHLLLQSPDASTRVRIGLQAEAVSVDGEACVQIKISNDGDPVTETGPSALFDEWDMLPINGPSFHRAVAVRLVRNIDGTLDCQHTETGSRFCITLPAARGAS